MTDVIVVGGKGKMGSLTAATVAAQDDLRLAAIVDPNVGGAEAVPAYASLSDALAAGTYGAAIEFSLPASVFDNARALLDAGVPTVVGATGLRDAQIDELRAVAAAHDAGCVIATNFALGAVLMMRFAAEAARYFGTAEIVELHESGKKDAPSGTALYTARLMSGAPDSKLSAIPGDAPSRGLGAGDVRIHSVRLPGLVAHQEVLLGGGDELLTLRHDSYSRACFMGGVLLALRAVTGLKETVVGLENLLD
jgi:4-hydroxy-tetrahydrodipicolinate reductase